MVLSIIEISKLEAAGLLIFRSSARPKASTLSSLPLLFPAGKIPLKMTCHERSSFQGLASRSGSQQKHLDERNLDDTSRIV